eukprot:TRINITY_DN6797_c0_g1_i7.p1 TRINITY_DN6797_c0_g1~~TRINITY_DN6797_c0_g1_i7.p1  ORF type:complete len:331 (-),score=46.29 TRINITY_DN6797_c0_g1_i7:167-1159(-)
MEKFNRWADPRTGIQPFLPPLAEPTNLLCWFFQWFILGPILFIIRLPFILTFALLLFCTDFLCSMIPLPSVRRLLRRLFHFVLVRLLLFFMGFWYIDSTYAVSRRRTPIPSNSPGQGITRSHVIVSNHNSYVDVLYLAYMFSPTFTATANYWQNGELRQEGVAVKQTLFQAIWEVVLQPKRTFSECEPLDEILSTSDGPVVVFPEGTTVNGKVLLGCIPVISGTTNISKLNIHVVAFKYRNNLFSPVYTIGSFWLHLIKLCSQVNNQLSVTYVIEKDIQVIADDQSVEWPEKLYSTLAMTLGIPQANIKVDVKHSFQEYWYQYKDQYKKK